MGVSHVIHYNVRAVNHVLKEKTHLGSKEIAEAHFSKSA
jgi:hypothetical protein